ncbi:MAG: hypothetical protein LIR50_19690 [Bacillota bacterium]|nr:hypothetical protein [Bacillota bacterium]
MEEKIYYFSNIDHEVHNIHDIEHYNIDNNQAALSNGKKVIIDIVTLHTLNETIEMLKMADQIKNYKNIF